MQKKDEVHIIHKNVKKKKILNIIYYCLERVEYIEKSLSIALQRDEVAERCGSASPLTSYLDTGEPGTRARNEHTFLYQCLRTTEGSMISLSA